ncbi:GDP-D-glucose phosphorylase 1 [Sitodiplosis mosellana]|uniref:GDP-D-glucose phosphorylase 1 n=1 Tax=Sitodiplosis mosellana TaxID=263140 RepID=UPI002444BE50|nr:GDP-D-glucose phosphorylase 1 [Sitodiplosis mosellana]
MSEVLKIQKLADFKALEKQLNERWLELERDSNAFRYKLNVQKRKILDGKLHFILTLNTDRTLLRRKPQVITSVVQPFNQNAFNFNKVDECEVLLRCQNQLNGDANSTHGITTFLVNNSPITKCHSLICPRLTENLSQSITKECIEFAIDLITGLEDHGYRIGYNSLGAFSSVNHLHLHLIHVTEKMYVEDAEITPISDDIYRMDFPAFALCLPIFHWRDKGVIASKISKIVEYFRQESIPHNIFWTYGTHSNQNLVKVFIFPRNRLTDKISSSFNAAFCELTGFVPIGDAEAYEQLSEDFIIDCISEAMGEIDKPKLVSEITKLISNESLNSSGE